VPYGWNNTAPIRAVDPSDVNDIATTLRQHVAAWGQGSEIWDNTRRYHTNKTGAVELLQVVEIMGGEEFSYVYEYGGLVLGLLLASDSIGCLYIADLLAHPGTEGAGATLLEFAVNLSHQQGYNGKLKLFSLNQNSSDFYLKMGFARSGPIKPNGGGDMTFDPASRDDLWAQTNDGWALKAYVGKRFAGAT
jgi:hypothetical protein